MTKENRRPLKAELDTAMQRIGELTMENELLWVRVRLPFNESNSCEIDGLCLLTSCNCWGSMMPGQYTEKAFATAIEAHLVSAGWYEKADRDTFDPVRGFFPLYILTFIKETQPQEWEYLANLQKGKAEEILLDDLCRALNSSHEGYVSVLRHGFMGFGRLFRAAYFAPASGLNLDTQKLYAANHLTITRQLRYSNRHGNTLWS